MSFLSIFKKKKAPSAHIAKERLKVTIAHQRGEFFDPENKTEFMEDMKKEILAVVNKYFEVSAEDIGAKLERESEQDILSLNINLLGKKALENINNHANQ